MTKTIPKLRFPEFSDELSEKEVGDFAPLQRGFDLPASQTVEGQYPVVFSNGILKFHSRYKVKGPGVVTGRSGTIGRVTYVEDNYWPHNTALWVTDFCNNIPKYVYYFYEQLRLEKFAAGSGVPTLNRNDVHQQIVYVPSPEEQQKIATFLSGVDKKIGQLAKKKHLLLKYKKGVMQQIFGQKIRFKDDTGNTFPDWAESPLGTLCKVYDGTHMTPDYQESGVPFYSVEHVTSNNFSETKYIAQGVYESEKKRVVLEKGDILMTRIGDIGTSKYISWDVKASFYVSLALIKKSSKINPLYLDQFMKSDIFQRELHRRTLHVAFPKKINLGEISECKVLIPVKEEQIKIAKLLSALDQRVEFVTRQAERLRTFKTGLSQQLFV